MDPEARRRTEELFLRLLELEPAARVTALAAQPPTLAEEVRCWLDAYDREASWLERGALAALPELEAEWRTATPGRRIGPYRVLSELGRGGMGAVYLARRDDPTFPQQVAVKLIRRGMDSEQIVARFLRERRILAGLVHPNIARLLDGGTTEDGRPYFVLEHVVGRPITVHVRQRELGLEDRLRLLLEVCRAVQYAHQRLIVHRDLKPANILVDAEGEPKLLDFGIAKLLDAGAVDPLESRAVPTGPDSRVGTGPGAQADERADMPPVTGLLAPGRTATHQGGPLTPAYASPEQLAGEPVTTASDVYSLGVLLFELLTGRNPRGSAASAGPPGPDSPNGAGDARNPASPRGGSRINPAPSSRAARGQAPRPLLGVARPSRCVELPFPSPSARGRWARRLAGDLDAIVSKALEPDPGRRYATAAALAEDLERHLERRPVRARRATPFYRWGRAVLRHRWAFGALLAVLLLAAAALFQSFALARQQQRSQSEYRRAEALAGFLENLFGSADPDQSRGASMTAREILDVGARRLARPAGSPLAPDPQTRASLLASIGNVYARLGLYSEAETQLRAADASGCSSARLDHGACAQVRVDLARVLANQGRYGESESLLHTVLDERHGPSSDPWTEIEALDLLGLVALEQGRFDDARRLLTEALELCRSHRRTPPRLLAETSRSMANLEAELGHFDRAAALLREAAERFGAALGVDHTETLRAWNDLATVVYQQGDFAEAARIFEEVLAVRGQLLGPDHPEMAQATSNLAVVQQALGRLDQAEASLRRAVAIRRRSASPPPLAMARSLSSLATVLRKQGRWAEASEVYAEAASVLEQSEARSHPERTNIYKGWTRAELGANRPGRAEELARQGLASARETFGDDHFEVADAWRWLADAAAEGRNHADAEGAYRQAIAVAEGLPAERRPGLAGAWVGLGRVLLELDRASEARAPLERGVELREGALAADHWRLAAARAELARALHRLGDTEAARSLLARALPILVQQRGEEARETRRAREVLAWLDGLRSDPS